MRERKLLITNEEKLRKYLIDYNYYRLSGYSLKYRDKDNFKSYVYDEHIYQAFDIDVKMRLLLFGLCINIESKFKTKIAYVLGQVGPLSYLGTEIYNSNNSYDEEKGCYLSYSIFESAFEYVKKNNAKIYEHHREKYDGNYPIWVIIHFLSFGDAIKLFSLLKEEYRNKISYDFTKYIISDDDFEQYMAAINCLRNACAHGDRLINKGLSRKIPKYCFNKRVFHYISFNISLYDKISSTVYGYLIAIAQLLSNDSQLLNNFYEELVKIFETNYLIKPDDYSFVNEWCKNIKMSPELGLRIKNIKHEYK